jgi:hypothetical protein
VTPRPDYAPIPVPRDRPRHVIVQAYVETGALDRPCGGCGAEPASWCTDRAGVDRRTPCVVRCKPADPEGGGPDTSGTPNPAEDRSDGGRT